MQIKILNYGIILATTILSGQSASNYFQKNYTKLVDMKFVDTREHFIVFDWQTDQSELYVIIFEPNQVKWGSLDVVFKNESIFEDQLKKFKIQKITLDFYKKILNDLNKNMDLSKLEEPKHWLHGGRYGFISKQDDNFESVSFASDQKSFLEKLEELELKFP